MHLDAMLCEGKRDSPGADAKLERPAIAGQLGEQVDGGVDDRRVEHVRGGLVVPSCDTLVEVAVVVHRGKATARPGLSSNGARRVGTACPRS